jgi:hypothetical protein
MASKNPKSLNSPPLFDRLQFRLRGTAGVRALYRSKRNKMADAFILSFPKCGRTWLRVLLGKAISLHHGIEVDDVGELDQFADARADIPRIRFKHDDNPHFKTPGELVRIKNEYADRKVVVLARDVRDTVISMYFQITKREMRYRFEGELSEFLKSERGSAQSMIEFYNIWADQRDAPADFLMMRYEDLHTDTAGQLKTLLEFLGVPGVSDEHIAAAVDFASFDNMRKMETAKDSKIGRLSGGDAKDPNSLKTRKGKVGGYKEYLNEDEVAWLDRLIAERLNPIYKY